MKYGIHSLVFKQCVVVLLGFTIVFAFLFGLLRYQLNNRFSEILMERGAEISEKNVNLINRIFSDAELIGQNVRAQLGKERPDAKNFPEIMKRLLMNAREKVPETVALGLATDTSSYPEYMRLVHVEGDSVAILEGKGYMNKAWYQNAKKAGKPMWQEPFIGDFVKEPIAVYTIPLFVPKKDGSEQFLGVICVDISIAFLQESVSNIRVENKGYAFVLSPKKNFVAHPNKSLMNTLYFEKLKAENSNIKAINEAIDKKSSGVFVGVTMRGETACIYYTPMIMEGWTFGIVWPADSFFERQRTMIRYFGISLVVGYLFLLILVLLVSFRVARPLNKMSRIAHDLGKGDFNVKIPRIPGKDEVAQFAQAFNKMRESLVEYIDNLKNVTNQKLRMEGELKVARDIQLGVLPKDEDEERMRDERHELTAFLQPARGVGGDFYDFYPLDKNRIVVAIADVSGKGIPAALFMMSVRTQLKSLALAGHQVAQVLDETNERLCHKNESNMFVTVWMGVLDLNTGHMDFCSAGHNPPVLCHTDGTVEFLKIKPGLVLAGMPDMHYQVHSVDLKPGERLFLYTDGVTEASNEENQFFGDNRLLMTIEEAKNTLTNDLCRLVKAKLDEFVGNAPQFDDITMLAVKYNGVEKKGDA